MGRVVHSYEEFRCKVQATDVVLYSRTRSLCMHDAGRPVKPIVAEIRTCRKQPCKSSRLSQKAESQFNELIAPNR